MVVLDGASLTIESLAAVAEGRDKAILAPAARDRMAEARKRIEDTGVASAVMGNPINAVAWLAIFAGGAIVGVVSVVIAVAPPAIVSTGGRGIRAASMPMSGWTCSRRAE